MDYLLWSCLTSLLLNYAAASTGKNLALGEGFYLPKKDLLEDTFAGGANIFTNLPNDCFRKTSLLKIRDNVDTYKDLSTFYKKIETSLGLPKISVPNYFTLTPSLAKLSIDEKVQVVSGSSLDVKSAKEKWTLSKNCINREELSKEMLADFNNLPESIENPERSSSWKDYSVFLKKYGSHVAIEIDYGSRLIQWEVSRDSRQISANTLKAKACIDLYGYDAISGGKSESVGDECTKLSSESVKSARRVSSENVLIVRGGSTNLQVQLRTKKTRTIDLINQFLVEGQGEGARPIEYEWTPIYTILEGRLKGDSNVRKVTNLKMFFEGMLSYGCTYQREGDIELRKFVILGTPQKPEYQCQVPRTGCRKDGDCKRELLSGCYCYGSSCIDELRLKGGEKKDRQIRWKEEGGTYEGVNLSCEFSWGACECQREGPDWETVWSSDQADKDEEDDTSTEEDTEGDHSGTAGTLDDQEPSAHYNSSDRDRA